MTPGEKFLATVKAIPETTPKIERIAIYTQAQIDFNREVEDFRSNERLRLSKLRE